MTATKRLVSFFMAVLMTFSLLAVSASAATPRNGFNVSYRMDGENVVETIVFSDAHAIPLDVLASISSLFSISTDELLGLDAPEVLSLSGLTGAQKKTLIKLRNELLSPSQKGNDLSPQQMEILHDIIKAFG